MLFDDIGEHSAGNRLREIVDEQLADDSAPRTPDIGGVGGTEEVVEDLRARLEP
jgi:tartrate dehydrogenase/decarboxylase/D-malate dehydrogenase